MKSPLLSVTIKRSTRRTGFGDQRGTESRASKTWGLAGSLLREWVDDPRTAENLSNTFLVRAKWKNGLVCPEVGLSLATARAMVSPDATVKIDGLTLGIVLRGYFEEQYGGSRRRLSSVKATMVRMVLATCSFSDATDPLDLSDDARAFDATVRALKACFPEHADLYIERVRSWMVVGGGVR